MNRSRVVADGVPEPPPGTFSNAILVDRTLYISGQTGAGAGVREQATEAFDRIRRLVTAAGGSIDDIVKLTVYLTDMSMRTQFSEARRAFFTGDFPCSTLVGISRLAQPEFVVEIDAIAVLPLRAYAG